MAICHSCGCELDGLLRCQVEVLEAELEAKLKTKGVQPASRHRGLCWKGMVPDEEEREQIRLLMRRVRRRRGKLNPLHEEVPF